MKQSSTFQKFSFYYLVFSILSLQNVFAQNVGIGTSSPDTKLKINGALGVTPNNLTAGATITIPENVTIVRITDDGANSANAASVTNPKEGQFLTILNNDAQPVTFASSFSIPAATGIGEFKYINGAWWAISITTGNSSNNWTKENTVSTPAIKSDNQYVTGRVGLGDFSSTPVGHKLHVIETGNDAAVAGVHIAESNAGQALTIDESGDGAGVIITANNNGSAIISTSQGSGLTQNATGHIFSETRTSTTANLTKIGVDVSSTGAWTGTGATNIGLRVNVADGTTNYAALFNGGNVGIGTSTPWARLSIEQSSGNSGIGIHRPGISAGGLAAGLGGGHMALFGNRWSPTQGESIRFGWAPWNGDWNDFTELMRIHTNGNVGIGTASPAASLDVAGRTLKLSNAYPKYTWRFGGAQDLNWKKIADITIASGSYRAVTFEVIVTDAYTNYGHSADAQKMTFYVSMRRSGANPDDLNDAIVKGPTADYVRAVRTATGIYELQVRQTTNWRHLTVEAQVISELGATVTYVDNPPNGSISGTIYTSSGSSYADKYYTIVNGSFHAGSTSQTYFIPLGNDNPDDRPSITDVHKLGFPAPGNGRLVRVVIHNRSGANQGNVRVRLHKNENSTPSNTSSYVVLNNNSHAVYDVNYNVSIGEVLMISIQRESGNFSTGVYYVTTVWEFDKP